MVKKKAKLPPRVTQYPWDKWFRGGKTSKTRQFRLNRYKDYHCMPHSMISLVRVTARKRGLRVSVRVLAKDQLLITLRKK